MLAFWIWFFYLTSIKISIKYCIENFFSFTNSKWVVLPINTLYIPDRIIRELSPLILTG